MKTLLITLLSLGLAVGASAQRGGHYIAHGGGGYHYAPAYHYYPRTYVGVGLGFGYGLGYGLGYGPWGWSPWGMGPYYGYPPYYYGYGATPPQLAGQLQGIKGDYAQQIKDVRHDKALSHREKRAKIDQLKLDRDNAVTQARHDFYFNSRRNYEKNVPNNTPPKNNNNGSSSGSSGDGPEYQGSGSDTGK